MFRDSQQIPDPWEGVLSVGVSVIRRTWLIKSIKSSRERYFVDWIHEYANNDDCKVGEQGNILYIEIICKFGFFCFIYYCIDRVYNYFIKQLI